MAQFDTHNYLKTTSAFNIQAISSDTTTVGNIIDTLGYDSVEIIFHTGTLDATTVFTPVIQESDDSTFATGVVTTPTAELIGTTNVVEPRPDYASPAVSALADVTFTGVAQSNLTARIGVLNKHRYVRVSIVTTLHTTGGTISAIAAMAYPAHLPTPKDK